VRSDTERSEARRSGRTSARAAGSHRLGAIMKSPWLHTAATRSNGAEREIQLQLHMGKANSTSARSIRGTRSRGGAAWSTASGRGLRRRCGEARRGLC
jgi:hypothetical protein